MRNEIIAGWVPLLVVPTPAMRKIRYGAVCPKAENLSFQPPFVLLCSFFCFVAAPPPCVLPALNRRPRKPNGAAEADVRVARFPNVQRVRRGVEIAVQQSQGMRVRVCACACACVFCFVQTVPTHGQGKIRQSVMTVSAIFFCFVQSGALVCETRNASALLDTGA